MLLDGKCPPLSTQPGRCGPSFGGRCNKNLADYAKYCNIDNGWCGETNAHKDAQADDRYDWDPKSCQGEKNLTKTMNSSSHQRVQKFYPMN